MGKSPDPKRKKKKLEENKVGRLDLRPTHKLHGSKPTKSQHTNKSKKKFGAIFVGIFGLGRKTTKSS